MDDVLLSKMAVIERCLKRIQEELEADNQLESFTHQDAAILNLERACQAAIDSAMHLCATKKLGIPKSSSAAFLLLKDSQLLNASIAEKMIHMTGFRNLAVHDYQKVNHDILLKILKSHTVDFIEFAKALGYNIELLKG